MTRKEETVPTVPAAIAAALILFAGAAPADEFLFAVTTDYGTSGRCATVELEAPWPAVIDIEPVSSDPVVRQHGNLIYVVNRLYADNIQVLDPDLDFDTILEFSVGAGATHRTSPSPAGTAPT